MLKNILAEQYVNDASYFNGCVTYAIIKRSSLYCNNSIATLNFKK